MSWRLRFSSIPGGEEDRISALSDTLLHHILSFLSMKDAAITTVLSTRWQPLFFSQRILNFEDKPFPNASAFRQFFNFFIANRVKNLPILSFHLKCCHHSYCKNDIPNFVSTALQEQAQNLTIDLCHSMINLSSLVLSTKTLSVLNLKRIRIDEVPSIDLPSLKVLQLESVTFAEYKYLTKLLSGCPILEDLETKDLIVEKNYRVLPGDSIYLSNLVRANISGEHILYSQLCNAHHLRLHVIWPYKLDSIFHNLTHLEITLDFDPELAGKLKWSWLKNLLPNLPNLQILIIHEVDTVNNFGDGTWVEPNIVPACLLSHLTTCSLRNYSRINCELQFAKYILQNSRVLSTMTIQIATSLDTSTKLQMIDELRLCPMNSAACRLIFE